MGQHPWLSIGRRLEIAHEVVSENIERAFAPVAERRPRERLLVFADEPPRCDGIIRDRERCGLRAHQLRVREALFVLIFETERVPVIVNGVSAMLFMSGRKSDPNLRAAFLHLAADAGLALGVAIAGAVMLATGWRWLDPAVSIILSIVIQAGTWSLLKSSTNLVLNAVPDGVDLEDVRLYLMSLSGVTEVHDLHIWAMSTTEMR